MMRTDDGKLAILDFGLMTEITGESIHIVIAITPFNFTIENLIKSYTQKKTIKNME